MAGGNWRVVAYFTSWGVQGKGYYPAKIPAGKLTHLNYAFSVPDQTSPRCLLGDPEADLGRPFSAEESVDGLPASPPGPHGNFNQLLKLKRKFPHLKILASIGGWTGSAGFSQAASTPASRRAFTASCVDLHLNQYPGVFDGLDIDWEFPVSGGLEPGRPEDRENFCLLLAELRRCLDARAEADRRYYLLTIAASARPAEIANLDLERIHPLLDWINLMTYDFHIFGEPRAAFNAPLFKASDDPSTDPVMREHFNVDSAVRAYLQAGVPPEKLVLGLPFYGRAWKVSPGGERGLYAHANGPAGTSGEPGILDYSDLAERYLPRLTPHWHPEARVPWLYSPQEGLFISYDDPDSIGLKVGYAREHGLGGVMFWELSCDNGDLLDAITAASPPSSL